MSRSARKLASGLVLLAIAEGSGAYEVGTHQRLTELAFERSVLANLHEGPLTELGVKDLKDLYASSDWEGPSRQVTPRAVVGLGARFEDFPLGKLPALNTPTAQWRFLRHFFDEQNGGTGLEYAGLGPAHASPNWILEDVAEIPEQEFSLRDAQQFYYNALGSSTQEGRERNLVLLLEAMGRGTHHLQDMAQPAHSRGDAHPPWPVEDDLYEQWTEALYAGGAPIPANLIYGTNSVELEQFDTARKFWTNQQKGIAEFTSRNFVSKDTNFRVQLSGALSSDPLHQFPVAPTDAQIERKTLAELGITPPGGAPVGQLWFLGTQVSDSYMAATSGFNQRASTLSALSADLQGYTGPFPVTTLNRLNFESNYQWLLPRAIAYSAGLINYFFRGKLALVSYQVSGTTVTVTTKNVSAANFALSGSAAPDAEEFSLFYDANDGQRHRLPLVNDELGSESLARDATRTFTFSLPADVSLSESRPFTLVFNGTVGQEAGIAALAFGSAGAAFLVQPNFLPADGIAGPRVIRWNGSRWQLTREVGKVAGNVDWRGHRGEVLTWEGPSSRYFYTDQQRGGISPNIYFDGALITQAPANVLGVAVRGDANGRELIAAVYNEGQFEVYVRPFRTSYTNDNLFEPTTNPEGWRRLHASALELPMSPMFFNASANEAQMFVNQYKTRIRMQLAQDIVTVASSNARGTGVLREKSASTGQITWVPYYDDPVLTCWTAQIGTITSLDTYVWQTPITTVCADYRGDVEQVCQVDYETLHDYHSETVASNAAPGQTPRVGTRSSTGMNKYFDGRLLRVGSLELPMSATGFRDQNFFTSQYENRSNYSSSSKAGRTLRGDVNRSVRIPFVDARYGILTHSVNDILDNKEYVTTMAGSLLQQYTSTRYETRDMRFAVFSPDGTKTLARQTINGTPERKTTVSNYDYPLNYECRSGMFATGNWESTKDTPFTDSDSFGYAIESSLQQGYAVFGDGRFAASQQVKIRNTALPESTWNYLSDGDFSSLFVGAPANATYYPVRLLR